MRHVSGVWNGAQVSVRKTIRIYIYKRHLENQVKSDNELKLLMVSVPNNYTATDTLSVSPYLKKVNNNESIIYYTHKPLVGNSNTNSFLLFLHNFPFNGIY